MYRLVSIVLVTSLLVGCSSKEKQSTTLNERASYNIPYADLQVGEPEDLISDKFHPLKVKVWKFEDSTNNRSSIVGQEIEITVNVPKKEFQKWKRKKMRGRK